MFDYTLRFLIRAAALALALAAFPASAADRTLLVFGDSLSAAYGLSPAQGWVSLLAKRLAAPWKVVNASISGETTAGGVRRLAEDLKRHKPAVVVIELGGNDALRGQPIAVIRANLEKMISLTREARAEPVLVGLMIPPNYGIDYATEFRDLFPALAAKHKVTLAPFLLQGVAERRELFQPDQVHPVAEAQPMILDNVWPALEAAMKKAR
jgi:acyl-CoA thioesterase-1